MEKLKETAYGNFIDILKTSKVPLIVRLAREKKVDAVEVAIFNYHRLTGTYEDIKKNYANEKFLKYFEYN